MLEMRPNCECCDRDLPPDAAAMICSFKCTWCPECATRLPHGLCPNCGGEMAARPRRSAAKLDRFPASSVRVFNPDCRATLGTTGGLA